MLKKLLFISLMFFGLLANAQQFVINEIDSDTPSTDVLEFVEIKSEQPFTSLNGYVLVFYNGNTTGSSALKVYYSVDLSGLTTDANALVVIGNTGVSPVPDRIIPNSTIQNGPDVVAIYQGSVTDFPEYTNVTTTGLIHAIGHGNASTPPTELMEALGITTYAYENANGSQTAHSIQRANDGTYYAGIPTPGALNDNTGITFNGITITVDTADKNEGDSFPITFTTQQPVSQTLNFTYSLENGNFDADDYVADLNVSIPAGQTFATKTIQILADGITEGDESLRIKFGTLPQGFVRMNDFIYINVIDEDFTVADFGTPLNPTYGQVQPEIPAGYYQSLDGLSGADLKQAIQDIITDSAQVKKRAYADIPELLKQTDQNPENSNQVWLMYYEQPRAKNLYQLTSTGTGYWNREHIYPQSRGGFANGTDTFPVGVDYWEPTNADDIMAGHSDAHHLRAEDAPTNSSRNNKDYGLNDYNGPQNNQGSWKGDVARSLFFMAVRYNILDLVDGNPADNTMYQMGDLETLLQWDVSDPADDFEMNRNNIIYEWQGNRNPFIDLPDLAEYVFGSLQNTPYQLSLSNKDQWFATFKMYPNPAKDVLVLEGIEHAEVEIFNASGQKLKSFSMNNHHIESLSLSQGLYLVCLKQGGKTHTEKLVIK